MEVTYDTALDQFTISSDNLVSFANIDTVTLTSTITCAGDYSDTIIEGDVTDGSFVVDNTALFETTDELEEGVYYFKLEITYTDETNDLSEQYCMFVDKGRLCDLVTIVAEEPILDLQMDYYILANAKCTCECTNLCAIYKRIKEYESDPCSNCTGC